MEISFDIIDMIYAGEYRISVFETLTFIKFNRLKYLIVSDLGGMGQTVECSFCRVPIPQNIGSVITGNGYMYGTIICSVCETLSVCLFKEESRKSIIKNLNIEKEVIDQLWDNINKLKVC